MGALPSTDLKGYEALQKRIRGALELLREVSSVEFKQAAGWSELKKGLPKDIIGMSNVQDGGIIIIGIGENDGQWNRTGLTDEQLNTYDPDDMIDHVNKYASPSITFDVVLHTDDEGSKYLVIRVHEFGESPIVCKKEYFGELRRGALYVRPLGKAESREVQSAEEMRDLLDLAAEKKTRNFLHQIRRVGIDVETVSLTMTDSDKFDEELGDLS
ncbi:MAG: RNA-binding domain-containing protein [Planctomycetota bacterium]|jgi:predicted HTH transcriptional regulator